MSTELRTAAQQALEALESLQGGCTDHDDGTVEAITVWCPEVIDALRAALAQPAVSEPVAWIADDTITRHTLAAKDCPPNSQVMLVSSIRRLRPQQLSEAEETIWQLTRALREAVESPTFMGEPVLRQPAVPQGEPVAWMNVKYGTFFGAGVIATTDRNDDLIASGELIRLYAHPPAQPPREPLTSERVFEIWERAAQIDLSGRVNELIRTKDAQCVIRAIVMAAQEQKT